MPVITLGILTGLGFLVLIFKTIGLRKGLGFERTFDLIITAVCIYLGASTGTSSGLIIMVIAGLFVSLTLMILRWNFDRQVLRMKVRNGVPNLHWEHRSATLREEK